MPKMARCTAEHTKLKKCCKVKSWDASLTSSKFTLAIENVSQNTFQFWQIPWSCQLQQNATLCNQWVKSWPYWWQQEFCYLLQQGQDFSWILPLVYLHCTLIQMDCLWSKLLLKVSRDDRIRYNIFISLTFNLQCALFISQEKRANLNQLKFWPNNSYIILCLFGRGLLSVLLNERFLIWQRSCQGVETLPFPSC